MNSLLQTLTESMGDDFLSQVTSSLGSDTEKTKGALDMALPLLMGALNKNNAADKGEGLLSAVSKKHDGSIFNNLSELISNPDAGEGKGILGHLFGGNEENAEKMLATQAGISESESGNILKILAPMVMGAIGKNASEKSSSGFDISSLSALVSGGAKESDEKSSLSSSLLTSFLDQNGDGNIADDLIGMAMKKFM